MRHLDDLKHEFYAELVLVSVDEWVNGYALVAESNQD